MTRSLAAPTRYFKAALAAAVIIAAPAMAQQTSQSPLTDEDMEIVRKSKEIAESAQAAEMPDWLRTDNAKFSAAHQNGEVSPGCSRRPCRNPLAREHLHQQRI